MTVAKSALQLDFFNMLPAKDHLITDADIPEISVEGEFMPKRGSPQYMTAQHLIYLIDYEKLNAWQKKIVWPHLKLRVSKMGEMLHQWELWFELGYIVGCIESELTTMGRLDMNNVAKKYGAEFFFTRGYGPTIERNNDAERSEYRELRDREGETT